MASTTSKDSSNNGKRKKVLLLTGACNGIGKALIKEFYKSDYNIMINDVQPEELKEIAENTSKGISKNSNDTKIAYFFGDISQQETSRSLIEETVKKFGSIDILINNISTPGISVIGKTTSNYVEPETTNYFTLEEYGISDRNLKGAYLCIRELVQYLINNNKVIIDEENIKDMETETFSIINISCPFDSIPDDLLYKGTISQSGVDPFASLCMSVEIIPGAMALTLIPIFAN